MKKKNNITEEKDSQIYKLYAFCENQDYRCPYLSGKEFCTRYDKDLCRPIGGYPIRLPECRVEFGRKKK